MEFTFSDEQHALRDAVRSFLAAETPMAAVRAHLEEPVACPPSIWDTMVSLGWHALLVPTELGGLGGGPIDAVAVAEELGRALHGGPMLATGLIGVWAARLLHLDDLLQRLANGTTTVAIALEEAGHGDPVDRIRSTASGRGESYSLHGTKVMVIDAHTATELLVAARTREGIQTFLVDPATADISWTPSLDLTRKTATIEFRDTPATRVGPPGAHPAQWSGIRDFAALLLAAEMVGLAEAANALALAYAQEREVFGKPLSKYQVTRHKAVDLLREIELARVGVHAAACAMELGGGIDAVSAVAMAKSYAAEAANHMGAECIQIHGGLGYTWECDAHLYLRRAKVNDLLFGAQSWQRARIADAYFAGL